MIRALPLLAALLASACSQTQGGGALVSLRFLQTDSKCAIVYATDKRGQLKKSAILVRDGKDKRVGIAQGEDFGGSTEISANGFASADCTGSFIDQSQSFTVVFEPGITASVFLELNGKAPKLDGGMGAGGGGAGAGGGSPTGGGTATGGGVGGGAAGGGGGTFDGGTGGGGNNTPEDCDNGVDDNLDGRVDCEEVTCLGMNCGTTDGGQQKKCTRQGPFCEVPLMEVNCVDNQDDDNDSLIDCADPECSTKPCDDKNGCTAGETCGTNTCSGGTPKVCNAPTECQLMGTGMCLPDAGCGYTARTGACDGGTCSSGICALDAFQYDAANFDEKVPVANVGAAVTLNCGTSRFNSDLLIFTNWCGQPQPTPLQVRIPNSNDDAIVLPMRGLNVSGTLELTGSRPVILAVFGNATVSGTVTVSGASILSGGGGPAPGCGNTGGAGVNGVVFSGGGGGGGAFGAAGAPGGGAQQANGTVSGGGGAGFAASTGWPVPLRGGCPGGDGAIRTIGFAAGGGGAGGAVQLSVSGTLTVSGRVLANGAGGRGATAFAAGGGGGGSGGGIIIEAGTLVLNGANLFAQGGGGGGGARDSMSGGNGQDGHASDSNEANGGMGAASTGGNGGKGGTNDPPTVGSNGSGNVSNIGGGGGGGGGAGRIWLRSHVGSCSASSTNISPDPFSGSNCP